MKMFTWTEDDSGIEIVIESGHSSVGFWISGKESGWYRVGFDNTEDIYGRIPEVVLEKLYDALKSIMEKE